MWRVSVSPLQLHLSCTTDSVADFREVMCVSCVNMCRKLACAALPELWS